MTGQIRRGDPTTWTPTARELAAIDREWPLIAAGLADLDREIAVILAADTPTPTGTVAVWLTAGPTVRQEAA